MTSTASSVSTITRSLTPTSAQRFAERFAVRSRTRLSLASMAMVPSGVAFPLQVALGHLPGALPAADVVPVEAPRHDGHPLGLLHDAVVDRDRRELEEDLGEHGSLVGAPGGGVDRGKTRREGREVLRDGVGHHARPVEEHPGVPEVALRREQGFRALGVGLLDEARRRVDAVGDDVADLDVAVAGLGAGRANADGGDPALLGRAERPGHRLAEGGLVADVMVRREHGDDGVGVGSRDGRGRPPDARRGVARDRFGEYQMGAAARGEARGRSPPRAERPVAIRRRARAGSGARGVAPWRR